MVRVLASESGHSCIAGADIGSVVSSFVRDGFVLVRDLVDLEVVSRCNKMIMAAFNELKLLTEKGQIELDVHGFAFSIMNQFSKTSEYEALISSQKLLDLLQTILEFLDLTLYGLMHQESLIQYY